MTLSDQEMACEREAMRLVSMARADLERAAKLTGMRDDDIETALLALPNQSVWNLQLNERREET